MHKCSCGIFHADAQTVVAAFQEPLHDSLKTPQPLQQMDPLHERQLSSSAAGPSHTPEGPGSQSESLNGSQYGGLSFVSVRSADVAI